MKFAYAVLLLCSVAACSSSPPRLPQNIEPIVGAITFGVRPVEQGQHVQVMTLSQRADGRSQSASISTQSIADIKRTAGEFMVHVEVIDTMVEGGTGDAEIDAIRKEIRELPGTKFTYTKNVRTGEERNKIRTSSFDVQSMQERAAGLTSAISECYMGGATVYQGQEITAAIPNITSKGTATSRVAGRMIYAGRPAVAFSLAGESSLGGDKVDVSGIAIVDIETGACVYSEVVASGIPMGRAIGSVTSVQRLTIY